MAYISMSDASRQFHVSKPTLSRAVKSGALSVAEKRQDGSFWFDPAEVARFKETMRSDKRRDVTGSQRPQKDENGELAALNARLEVELQGLKSLLDAERRIAEAERRRAETAEQDRDTWREQAKAQTLLLTHKAAQAPQERRSGLFGWLGGRKAANG